jgi:hypothetical protein
MTLMHKYICGECDERHDYELDAVDCCPTKITEVFICPVCQEEHHCEDEALDCCNTDPDFLQTPSHAELEAAGQMRLPI